MNMPLKLSAIVPGLLMAASAGCASRTPATVQNNGGEQPVPSVAAAITPQDRGGIIRSEERISDRAVATMPKAQAYRMSGDYAANVAIALAPDGSVQSYPAPSDITAASSPVQLADGWWLDRRGVTDRSVFTRYTLREYAALEAAPTVAELKAAVIPGARVAEVMKLPVTTAEALADTAAVNAYIAAHTMSARIP